MAVSYVGANNAAGQNAGTTTTASTVSITPTLPAGAASGDRVFVCQEGSNTAGTTPTNWTVIGSKDTVIGSGAVSAGAGQRYMSWYYRDYDGSWSMPAFTLTSAAQNSHWIGAVAVRPSNPACSFDTPTITTAGSDFGTANTAHSATTGSLTTHTDGFLVIGTVQNDNVTMTSGALTQSGATIGTVTERCDGGTSTGNDVAGTVHTASVTTGATAALVFTGTLSAASQGGSMVVEQTETFVAWPGPVFASAGTTAPNAGSPATTWNIPVPTSGGTGTGIIDIVFLFNQDSTTSITPPSGLVAAPDTPVSVTGARQHKLGVYWREAATSSGNYTFTLSPTGYTAGFALRYSGVDSTNPFDVTAFAVDETTANLVSPAVSDTTTVANTLLIWACTKRHTVASSCTPPTGFTERGDVGAVGAAVTSAEKQKGTAGATGSITGTWNDIGNAMAAWLGALKAPAGTSNGTSSGAYTWAGSATGDTPPNRGSSSGTYTWAGTTAGKRTPKATSSGTYTWAGSAVGVTPHAKMETLTDNFNSGIDAKWSKSDAGKVTATGGAVRIDHGTGPEYQSLSSVDQYDLTASYVYLKISDYGNLSLVTHQAFLQVTLDGSNYIQLGVGFDELWGWKSIGGSGSAIGAITIDTTNHRWLRIRESGGTCYLDTAPDGTTWTNRFSLANPFAVTALRPFIYSSAYGTEASGSYAIFDNVNTLGVAPPGAGTASGNYTWAGSATGDTPPNRGSSSGNYTWAGTATGDTPPNRGTSSGNYTWAGTAAGKRTPKATGSGAYTWVGSATGDTPPNRGTTSGNYTWAGSAAGKRTPKATSSGTYTWAGSATGDTPPNRGTTSGTYTWAGTATGKRTPKATGSGAYTWAGSAAGKKTSRGTSSGNYTWVGAATGDTPPNRGTTSGNYTWAGTTAGARTSRGTGSGNYTWSSSAAGIAPIVGAKQGTTSGSYTWVGATTGSRASRGTTSGTYTWLGSATGIAPIVGAKQGTASGNYTWAGSAAGKKTPKATGTATYGWDGAAIGWHISRATTSGTYTFVGTATGATPVIGAKTGNTLGAYGWTSLSTGVSHPFGTTTGTYKWAASTVFILTAPIHPDRYSAFTYETREMNMPAEDRIIGMPSEDRTISMPAETRMATLDAENRTTTFDAENRTATLDGEDRLITL